MNDRNPALLMHDIEIKFDLIWFMIWYDNTCIIIFMKRTQQLGSDSKQRTMSLQDRMEPNGSGSSWEETMIWNWPMSKAYSLFGFLDSLGKWSLNHVMISTGSNWFQTNSLEHESDNNHLLSVFYRWYRSSQIQSQIWLTFVAVLWLRKTEFQKIKLLILTENRLCCIDLCWKW